MSDEWRRQPATKGDLKEMFETSREEQRTQRYRDLGGLFVIALLVLLIQTAVIVEPSGTFADGN